MKFGRFIFAHGLLLTSALLAGCGQPDEDASSDTGANATTERPIAAESADGGGQLLIVGGALRSDNRAVYQAFIDGMPAGLPEVAIVPAASGRPAHYASQFAEDLRAYGFDGAIHVLPIAVKDDASTDVDESAWVNGGRSTEVAARLERVGGVWFVGGDQTRITQTLLEENGSDTPVLAAIRAQLARGAVVGGTSAGAAIMSQIMIAGGDSLSALTLPVSADYAGMDSQESGRLSLAAGLGFFPLGIVDQHFDRKSRLGRLIRALAVPSEPGQRVGFGVDEDTAMLVDLQAEDLVVLGAGNLVLVDARQADFSAQQGAAFSARQLDISVLSSGDRYNWRSGATEIAGEATSGNEAFGYQASQGAGLALPNQRLDQLLGFSLLDNRDNRELRRYAFAEESGLGVLFQFRQTDASRGFWRYGSGTKDQYSLLNVSLDVLPVAVSIEREVNGQQVSR